MNLIAQKFSDVYVYSTFFYTKLLSSGHQGVRCWNKQVDIFSKRLLLFPVHLQAHWCLAAVKIADGQISYYDSLGQTNFTCLHAVMKYLQYQSKSKKLNLIECNGIHCKDIPMQYNSYDCGVFVCMYARYLAADSPFSFDQEDMPNIRKHMALELLSKTLIF